MSDNSRMDESDKRQNAADKRMNVSDERQDSSALKRDEIQKEIEDLNSKVDRTASKRQVDDFAHESKRQQDDSKRQREDLAEESNRKQAVSEHQVQELIGSVDKVAGLVRMSVDKADRDRKLQKGMKHLLQALGAVMAGLLLLASALLFVGLENRHNGEALRDCLEPTGVCAQKSALRSQAIVRNAEVERNRAEALLAQQRGDALAFEFRTKRVADLEVEIKTILDRANQIK